MLDAGQRVAPPRSDSPYPGLVPYEDADAPFFFGREQERGIIAANLEASRFTLLYGESGVGKSSVLRAGVVHDIRRQARHRLAEGASPEYVVVEFASWRDDPIAGLDRAIATSVERTVAEPTPERPPSTRRLDRLLGHWTEQLDAELLLILDQFEEYFLYHGADDGEGTFAVEFPRAVNSRDLRANFLVAIREDALAKLDRFKGRIPNLFGNYLRIRHLDRESGRVAITKPLEQFNALCPRPEPVTIEPTLVEKILDQVAAERVALGQVGQGVASDANGEVDRIETPYLQLVLSKLWDEETAARSFVIRLETLERLGGAERIVRTHLDEAMQALSSTERDIAARLFRYLVTRSGSKVAHTAADLAEFAEVSEEEVSAVLERLTRGDVRILRSVAPPPGAAAPRYEIFHDVLAAAVLDWRVRHNQLRRQAETQRRLEQEKEEAEEATRRARRRSRTLAALLGAAALAVVGVLVLALWAIGQRNAADRATADAESAKWLAKAQTRLELNPQWSARFALRAFQRRPSSLAASLLRTALSASRVRGVVSGPGDFVSAELSPDGTRVVTAGDNGTASIASVASGAKEVSLRGHEDALTGAVFTPDGGAVVTTSLDGTARIWDPSTGDQIGEPLPHDGPVHLSNTDSFGSGGSYIATGPFTEDGGHVVTYSGATAYVWDIASHQIVNEFEHGEEVTGAAFSPDGSSVVTTTFVRALLWDRESEERTGVGYYPSAATFSPAGDVIAVGYSFGGIDLWDPISGNVAASHWRAHRSEVTSLRFSEDGTTLASAGGAVIKVWDRSELLSREQKTRPRADVEAEALVSEIRFSPDERYLVSANQDGTAQVWEVGRGGELFTLRGHTDAVRMAEFSPDGDLVVTSSEDGDARLWSVDTGEEFGAYTTPVRAVGFSPDGDQIVIGSEYGGVTVWETETGERVRRLRGSDIVLPLITATFTPDGDRVVAADDVGWVGIWDAGTGEEIAPIKEYLLPGRLLLKEVRVTDAELSPVPGQYRLLALYSDGSAKLWDMADVLDGETKGQVVRTFGGSDDPLTDVLFNSDGNVITVGGSDQTARMWDPESESPDPLWSRPIGKVGIVSTALSPDGDRIAIGGADRAVRVWDTETGRRVGEPLRGGSGTPSDLAFDTEGRWILAGGSDGTTTIWEAGTGDLLAILRMHSDGVGSVAASLGRIISGSEDHSAKLYSCETCVPKEELERFALGRLNLRGPRT